MMKNSSGYADPTAGMAISNVMREYRQQQKKEWARKHDIRSRPKVYAISPYAGDIEKHIREAVSLCRLIVGEQKMPIASHLMYPAILDDSDADQRSLGLLYGLELLSICDEAYVLTDSPEDISTGMAGEIHEARRLKIPIRLIRREELP